MNEHFIGTIKGLGYLFSIVLTVWGLLWGIPMIVQSVDSPYWKILSIIFLLPLLPMLPGIFTWSYKIYEIPKAYIIEYIDMYYSIFLILLIFPAVSVKVFFLISGIMMIATVFILFVWIFQSATGIVVARGVRFDDFLFYITIFNCGLMILFGVRYLSGWLEEKTDQAGEITGNAVQTIITLIRKRRSRKKRQVGNE